MKPFYLSKKFWVAAIGAVVLLLTDGLGLQLEADTVAGISAIVIGYVGAQGWIDTKKS